MVKFYFSVFVFLIFAKEVKAQNEFYLNGAHVTLQSNALLHVQGDFHLDGDATYNGSLNNDGLMELRGDFYIADVNTAQTKAGVGAEDASSTGTVRFKNSGYTPETTAHEEKNQRIYVNATAIGDRAFFKIELANNTSAINGDFVDITGDVQVKESVTFTNGRIRTDITSKTLSSWSTYGNELIVGFSGDAGDLIGDGDITPGSDKFVEGKLRRYTENGISDYVFPVGISPGDSKTDNNEPYSLTIRSGLPGTGETILGFLAPHTQTYGTVRVYDDVVADLVANNPTIDNVSDYDFGTDGIPERLDLTVSSQAVWTAAPSSTSGTIDYDFEAFPSNTYMTEFEGTVSLAANDNVKIWYLMHDLEVGNATSTNAAPAPWDGSEPGIPMESAGYLVSGLTLGTYAISALTSFSEFGPLGGSDGGVLPIELINFTASNTANEYIQLDWTTATEINNDGFEIERGTDGINFENIAWEEGNGSTSAQQDYQYDDFNVEIGQLYYYRLKQIDFDGTLEYSPMRAASIPGEEGFFMVSEFTPNPSNGFSAIVLTTKKDVTLEYIFFNDIGQVFEQNTIQIVEGRNEINFDLRDKALGTYFLTLNGPQGQHYRKLIKSIH
jgi:hypothetical protein